MKFLLAVSFVLQLVAAKVSYDGYKAFRIDTQGKYADVESAIAGLEFVSLSCEGDHKSLEVAIAPKSLDAFKKLGLKTTVLSEDVGAELASEGDFKPYRGEFLLKFLS